MAFKPSDLPLPMQMEWVKGPSNWKKFAESAFHVGLNDMDYVTSAVFYLVHPERNFRKIEPHEQALISEWKNLKKKIMDIGQVLWNYRPGANPKPTYPNPHTPPSWNPDPKEIARIRKDLGRNPALWAEIPPDGTEAAEFGPPEDLRADYGAVFIWKSAEPASVCMVNPRQRVQATILLRSDWAYWYDRTEGNRVAASILSTTCKTATGDYRNFVVNQKMCPRAAMQRLWAINQDVTARLFIAMLQLAAPAGVPTRFAAHTQQFASGMAKISEWASPAVDKRTLAIVMQREAERIDARRAELERSSLTKHY